MNKTQHILPGFKSSPLGPIPIDWEVIKLVEVCPIFKSGQGITSKDIVEKGKYPVYGGNGLRGYTNNYTHSGKFILIGRQGALCGNITLIDGNNYISEHAIAVQTDSKNNLNFLAYKLNSINLNRLSESSAQPGLSVEKLIKHKIALPPLPEQTAIANLLSTWDKAIETTQKLIAQKELRKKWLMQMLLAGKKKLKEYDNKWEETSFKKTFVFIKTYPFTRDELTTNQDFKSTYCIHYGDIHALYNSEFLDFKQQTLIPKITDYQYKVNEKDLLKDGDIIIADASEDYNGVGEAVEVINIQDKKAVGGLHTIVLRDTSGKTENSFRAYLFSSEFVRNNLRRKATGISVYSISKSTLEKLTFKLPEKQEQTTIAQILLSADKEIQFLRTKLERLKEQKKGLMQVLLTGKKRLVTDK